MIKTKEKKEAKEKEKLIKPLNGHSKTNRLVVLMVVLSVIIAISTGYFYYKQAGNDKKSKEIKGTELVAKSDIQNAKVSSNPNLEAAISGDYNQNEAICRWFVNGEEAVTKTKPVNGKCVLNHIGLDAVGKYEISYRLVGSNFVSKEITVTVK
jgi:hypothetical protein